MGRFRKRFNDLTSADHVQRLLLADVTAGAADHAALYTDDLAYVQDELRWIRVRIERIDHDTKRRALEAMSDEERAGYLEGDEDLPQLPQLVARGKRLLQQETALRTAIDTRRANHRADGQPLALDRLCDTWGLGEMERTVLLLVTSLGFSQTFNEAMGKVSGSGSQDVDVEAVFGFCECSYSDRIRQRKIFAPAGKLVGNDLITVQSRGRSIAPDELLGTSIRIGQQTFGFILGEIGLDDDFIEFSSLQEPKISLDQVVIPPDDRQRILSVVERHDDYLQTRKAWGLDDVITYGKGVLMLFHGKPGTGKTMTAHGLARQLGKRVLSVDIPTFLENRESERFLPGLFREARLHNAVLFFDECETFFADRRGGNGLMSLLLTEIERFEGVAILATNLPEVLDEALDRRILVKVRFADPDATQRLQIWRKHLPDKTPLAPDVDLPELARRFEMAGGYIKNAVLMAVAAAVHGTKPGEAACITMAHLLAAARDQMQRPLGERDDILRPQLRLSDVVVQAGLFEQLQELVDAARNSRQVLESWGIGKKLSSGKGVSALFHGQPGTGKTHAAQAIAGELERPLISAQIPALLSKWVGSTERNLAELFKAAKSENAVLLLDECDSLLADRGGAQQRHDVSMVNVLLHEIERHDGVVLLATNRAKTLDKALHRRLRWNLEFPLPDAELRARIWQGLLPAEVPVLGRIDFGRLGRTYKLSGGWIRNAVYKAAFRAARHQAKVSMAYLEEAALEEVAALAGDEGSGLDLGDMGVS